MMNVLHTRIKYCSYSIFYTAKFKLLLHKNRKKKRKLNEHLRSLTFWRGDAQVRSSLKFLGLGVFEKTPKIIFAFIYDPRFHVLGASVISIGNISSLPTSITKHSNIFEYGEYSE